MQPTTPTLESEARRRGTARAFMTFIEPTSGRAHDRCYERRVMTKDVRTRARTSASTVQRSVPSEPPATTSGTMETTPTTNRSSVSSEPPATTSGTMETTPTTNRSLVSSEPPAATSGTTGTTRTTNRSSVSSEPLATTSQS
jgi:hypothetical protein